MTTIIGIKLGNRVENSTNLQEKLTKYGCIIKTRLGLHDVGDNKCPMNGIILLEILDNDQAEAFVNELKTIENITVDKMVL